MNDMLLVSSNQWSIFCASHRTVKSRNFDTFPIVRQWTVHPLDHSFCLHLLEKTIFDLSALVRWIKDKKAVFAKLLISYQRIFFCILMNFYFVMCYIFLHTDLWIRRKNTKKEKKTKHIYIGDSHTITYWQKRKKVTHPTTFFSSYM